MICDAILQPQYAEEKRSKMKTKKKCLEGKKTVERNPITPLLI